MWALLFLLVASATAQDPLICPAYACSPPGYELSDQICIDPNTTTLIFQMSLCSGFSGTYGCVENPEFEKPSMCQMLPPPIVDKSLPGQPCNSPADCVGSGAECIANACRGLGFEKACSNDPECDVGLYCDLVQGGANGTCAFQLPANATCTRDEECSNEFACTGYTQHPNVVEGMCVPYYSLGNGEPVYKCENNDGEGVSNLCQSATCWPKYQETGGLGTCINPYVSKAPQSCTFDSNCTGTSTSTSKSQPKNYTTTKTCQCGYSSSATPYCPVFGGDNVAQSLLGFKMELIDVFASVNASCHTSLRFSDFCFSQYLSSSDFLTFQRTRDATEAFFKFQDNDYCVQANVLNDYYQLTEESLSCRAYSCASALNQSQCVAFNQGNNTYELSTCISGVCAVDNLGFGNVTCSAAQIVNGTVYPGEPCTVGSQCIVEGCTNGRCDGIQLGHNCTDSSQCDVGLYCNTDSLECEKLLSVNQQCVTESDCVMTAGCYLSQNQTQSPNQCMTYFTLPTGAAVYCPSSDFAPLCASAWCKSSPSGVFGVCATTPKSAGGLPSTCKTDDDCWDSTNTYKTTCTCGYNPTGQRYCGLFPGDSYYANLITDLNMAINEADMANAISNNCQTTRRFTATCLNLTLTETNSENFTMLQNYYQAKQFPLLQNNDACVKQMFTSEFWSIPPAIGNNTSSAVAVAVASVLMWLSLAG